MDKFFLTTLLCKLLIFFWQRNDWMFYIFKFIIIYNLIYPKQRHGVWEMLREGKWMFLRWSVWEVWLECLEWIVRNEEVCRRAGIERELASRADQRVLKWFGHVERMDEYRLDRRVLMAEVSGGGVRGRLRLGWMDALLPKVALGNTDRIACINFQELGAF